MFFMSELFIIHVIFINKDLLLLAIFIYTGLVFFLGLKEKPLWWWSYHIHIFSYETVDILKFVINCNYIIVVNLDSFCHFSHLIEHRRWKKHMYTSFYNHKIKLKVSKNINLGISMGLKLDFLSVKVDSICTWFLKPKFFFRVRKKLFLLVN